MTQYEHDTSQTRAERIYAVLLHLYPRGHRRDYGPLMRQTFRDEVRDVLAIGLATFFVVDNLFLAIVSQQVDKIQGFHHSTYRTMRDYVNAGLVYTLILLPLLGAAGAMFGAVGAAARKLLRGYAPASR